MSPRSSSRRLVVGESIALGVSYAIGLVAVLFVLPDLPAGQGPTLAVGSALFAIPYVVLFGLGARSLPSFLDARPIRYSIPLGIAIVAEVAWTVILRAVGAPDIAAYAGAIPLVIAGIVVSGAWSASAGASSDRGRVSAVA